MKKIYLFLICLLGMNNLFAQQQIPLDENRYLDSLDQVLRKQHTDSDKVNATFLLVDYWKFKDTVKSKNYLRSAQQLAGKYPYLKALYYFYEGQYYFNWDTKRASKAFKRAEEMLSVFPTKKAYSNRAAAWFNYALMNKDKKGYEFIISITLDKAIPNALKAGNMAMVAHYYTQLSTILMNNYQFTKAELYVQKAIELLEKENPKSSTLVFSYLSGVSIYCYENKAPKAKPLLQKALNLLKPYPESLNYPLYYYNEVLYYSTVNDLNHALLSTEKGITLAKKYNQKQLFQQFIFRKYTLYSQQKSYNKARQLLLDIVKEGTLVADLNDRAAIYAELAKTNQSLEDYKEAFQWQKRYSAVMDSIHNSQTKVKINELETKYQTAQNRQKIAALQAQHKQTILTAKNERLNSWLLAMGCVCLIIVLGFVLLTAKKNRRLAAQKEINFKQQLKEVEQQQQLHIAKAMLDGEEHERERVARDLHDGLGGMLAGVKIGLSGWSNNNSGISGDKDLYRIINQLDNSVGELRRIARNMVPETLLKFGLEVALKDLSEFYMQDDLQVDFQAYNIEKDIALTVQLNVYRIIQELFSNAIKHACASHIILQCSQNEYIFFITFEDDGCGFDATMLTSKKGMGLNNLKTRIAFLKGQFEIQSVVNEGTTINIEINTNAEG